MKRIGIVGGGQLGKMMILDAKRLDYYVVILDPTEHCPAHSIADEHIIAGFDDIEAIKRMAKGVDVVTYEFEHISLKALQDLEAAGCRVYPTSETLGHIQNKLEQKRWLRMHGIPIPAFQEIPDLATLERVHAAFGYPMMLKTCTGGYDGKGNYLIEKPGDERAAFEALGSGKLPLMVEEWVPFEKEVSVLVCRNIYDETVVFPVAENVHKNSILDETTVPAAISEETKKRAWMAAKECAKAVNAYGMLCVELFVTSEGYVMVNELAPRPHNSGHYTIEGCRTSQYENHIRAILGLPLGSTELIRPTAMKNLIGDRDGIAELTGLAEAYRNPNVKLHIYGKEKVAVGRKMGHITATGETVEEALEEVRMAHRCIRL